MRIVIAPGPLDRFTAVPEPLMSVQEARWVAHSKPSSRGAGPAAIAVDGMPGYVASNSRIRGSTASTAEPAGRRTYLGGASDATAARTVFLDTPNTRAITLIGIPSARCNLRISAQSSTDNTPSSSWLD